MQGLQHQDLGTRYETGLNSDTHATAASLGRIQSLYSAKEKTGSYKLGVQSCELDSGSLVEMIGKSRDKG